MISTQLVQQVYRHAEAASPVECCGYLDDRACYPCRNVWIPTPEAAPTAKAYEMAVAETVRLFECVDRCGADRVVIYHSHIDAPPDWSSADERLARWRGKVILPEVRRLIVGVSAGRADSAQVFAFREGVFRCVARFDALGEMVEPVSRQ